MSTLVHALDFFHSLPLHFSFVFSIPTLQSRTICFSNASHRKAGIFIAMFRWRHWLKNARDFEMGSKIAWHFNCTSGPGILDLSLMYLIVISYCDQNVVETLCLKNMDNVVQNLAHCSLWVNVHIFLGKWF